MERWGGDARHGPEWACMLRALAARRRVVAVVAAVLALPMLIPFGGQASHSDGCAFLWEESDQRSKSCELSFTGLPLTVFADSCPKPGSGCTRGPAEVRAWVTLSTYPVELASCEASGKGYASCEAALSIGEGFTTIAGTLPLVCHVEGKGGGQFACSSGCQVPSQGLQCELLATPLPTP